MTRRSAGCRDDHLKPTGFRSLATRRNASCAFRDEPCFLESVLQRSVSESSSQTIRIRAPSGTFNVKRERVLLSPVVSRVCVRRLIPRTLHFCVPVLGLTQICHHLLSESSHRLGASLAQAAADRAGPWICRDWAETVTERTPKKRFEASEAIRVLSKELISPTSVSLGFPRLSCGPSFLRQYRIQSL